MSFSEKNKHTLTNTDTMSPFLIFFIVVTLGYVLYYAAIITMDMNAKPKDAVTQGETMEAPDGMQTTEDNGDEDTEEETTSREADDENGNDNPEGSSEDETGDNHQEEDNTHGTYMNNDVPPTEPPYEPESETPEDTPSPEDDDVYGIDRQMSEEQSSSHEAESPSPEDNNPSYSEQTPSNSTEETSEPANTDDPDNGDGDEESEESIRAMILKEMQERAKVDGAEFVEAEVHDKNEFNDDDDDDIPVVEVNAQNCDTGRAADINASSEPIITESTTPVRQDRFAQNVLGALYKMKDKQKNEPEQEQKEEEKPVIDPDNIEKKENITKA